MSSEARWSQGPWEYDPDEPNSHDIYNDEGFHIGRATGGLPNGQAEANANLIAAAPDMAEALDGIKWFFENNDGATADELWAAFVETFLPDIDAALAKAHGVTE